MPSLFAALDATGSLRFIGEVERGADCNCSCPVCESPLVARQGAANDWHFAHEASPERPECEAAPIGLLRRLLIEVLQARVNATGLQLPPYRERVAIERSLLHVQEEVRWGARPMGATEWQTQATTHEPVATARLDTGTDFQLFVAMGEAAPPPAPADCAQAVFRCRVPRPSVLRDRKRTLQYLERHAELVWLQHPDTMGLVAAARERLEAQGRQVYRNWLALADAAGGPAAVEEARPPPLFYGPGAPAAPRVAPRYACAPLHAPLISFTFYRLTPSQAWLLYLLEREAPAADWRSAAEKFYALAPYPGRFDGWHEALPHSVGVADVDAGIVRCKGFLDAVTYLSRRAVFTRTEGDPARFADA